MTHMTQLVEPKIIEHSVHHHRFTRVFFSFITKHFSTRHYRRVITIASLYFYLMRYEHVEMETLKKLNNVMQLAKRNNSLYLPFLIKDDIWNNSRIKEEDINNLVTKALMDERINSQEAILIAKRIVSIMPSWVQYGRKNDMVNDIACLLMNGNAISNPN